MLLNGSFNDLAFGLIGAGLELSGYPCVPFALSSMVSRVLEPSPFQPFTFHRFLLSVLSQVWGDDFRRRMRVHYLININKSSLGLKYKLCVEYSLRSNI
jgi:hypothetical protein